MEPFFSPEILKKAEATPEQIEKAKKHGAHFWYEHSGEGVGFGGYLLNGCAYITEIKNLSEKNK